MKCLPVGILMFILVATMSAGCARDRALLIGINDYQDPRMRDLGGCEADAAAMRQMLLDRCGFQARQVKVLTGRDATDRAIRQAVEDWLIRGSTAGSRVVFYYSGHASLRPLPTSPETSGGILCPADYSPQTRENDVTTADLSAWLTRLDDRHVVMVVDADHAGAMVADPRPGQVALLSSAGYQTAQEILIPAGDKSTRRGAFTWALVKGMAGDADMDRNGTITNRELIGYVNRTLHGPEDNVAQDAELRAPDSMADQPAFQMPHGKGFAGAKVARHAACSTLPAQ